MTLHSWEMDDNTTMFIEQRNPDTMISYHNQRLMYIHTYIHTAIVRIWLTWKCLLCVYVALSWLPAWLCNATNMDRWVKSSFHMLGEQSRHTYLCIQYSFIQYSFIRYLFLFVTYNTYNKHTCIDACIHTLTAMSSK